MKSILIVYNQILSDELLDLLDELGIRGFTRWNDIQGRGSHTGVPQMGTHTWPGLNGAVLCVVDEEQATTLLEALKDFDAEDRGLRAFAWELAQVL